jgi:hypothetical protein
MATADIDYDKRRIGSYAAEVTKIYGGEFRDGSGPDQKGEARVRHAPLPLN